MRKRPTKHLPYFVVLEALGQPGCFLCTLIVGETRRYLRHLLDEYVNDPGFRKEWRASRGFCHRHSWMMADAPEALGLSILYLDLVDAYGESLILRQAGSACSVCAAEERQLKTLERRRVARSTLEVRGALRPAPDAGNEHLGLWRAARRNPAGVGRKHSLAEVTVEAVDRQF